MAYITMTKKDNERLMVINELLQSKINGTIAANKLNLSVRQVRRIKSNVRNNGAPGIIHQGRGRSSNNRLDQDKINKIVDLIKKNYSDFKPTLANEKLFEKHRITLGTETLRQIMIQSNIWKPKPRKKNQPKRQWRPRKEMFGLMIQYDGSYHYWLEDRAGELCLLLAVDDATGKIVHAKFDYHEGMAPTFNFWQEYIEKRGKPRSIYLDKFSTYKVNHKNAQDNKDMITQFQRACKELDIVPITAHSPEAKGRVERMFQTLQDRLIKEMRLANIHTIEQANRFLKKYIPLFNSKFALVPEKRGNAHRVLSTTGKQQIFNILAKKETRVVMNDYTISFETKYLQLTQKQPTTVYKKDKVTVIERIDGSLAIELNGKKLNYTPLPKRPEKVINVKLSALTRSTSSFKPLSNHPWRKQILLDSLKAKMSR